MLCHYPVRNMVLVMTSTHFINDWNTCPKLPIPIRSRHVRVVINIYPTLSISWYSTLINPEIPRLEAGGVRAVLWKTVSLSLFGIHRPYCQYSTIGTHRFCITADPFSTTSCIIRIEVCNSIQLFTRDWIYKSQCSCIFTKPCKLHDNTIWGPYLDRSFQTIKENICINGFIMFFNQYIWHFKRPAWIVLCTEYISSICRFIQYTCYQGICWIQVNFNSRKIFNKY